MLNRAIEWDLLPQTQRFGAGVIAFAPLASGLLTDKFLSGEIPPASRAATIWPKDWVQTHTGRASVALFSGLNDIAKPSGPNVSRRWRSPGRCACPPSPRTYRRLQREQLEDNVAALKNLKFSKEELKRIDELTLGMKMTG